MLNPNKYIDPEQNFPNTKVKLILNTLKPALVKVLNLALKLLPEEYIVDSTTKCNSTEMKRQYLAFDRAIEKWQNQKYAGKGGRPETTLRTIQKVYFTILSVEAHYLVLSAFWFDEYRKIRESNEDVERIA